MARQSHIKFTIPEPCNVPWNGMSPVNSERRHCSSCDKVITDFSKMSDDELMLYFKHSNGNVCGLFGRHQLDRRIKLLPEKTRKAGWWRMMLLIPLSLFSKSAKSQYYEYLNTSKQSQTTAAAKDSVITSVVVEKEQTDSIEIAAAPVDSVDSTITQVAESNNPKPIDSLVINLPDQLNFITVTEVMGNVGVTLGFCQMEPEYIPDSRMIIGNPLAADSNKDGDQLSEYEPIKDLTTQDKEKPKPQQPALPASTDISGILPKEDRKYKRS